MVRKVSAPRPAAVLKLNQSEVQPTGALTPELITHHPTQSVQRSRKRQQKSKRGDGGRRGVKNRGG